jgi:hypothetical protein
MSGFPEEAFIFHRAKDMDIAVDQSVSPRRLK